MDKKKDNRWSRKGLHAGWKKIFEEAVCIGTDNAGNPLYAVSAYITPEMASNAIEELNEENFRSLRDKASHKLAKDMATEKFTLNNDLIVFHPGFSLVNGQHRMKATVVSGKTVKMLIIFGNIDDKNMDTGMKRPYSDYLRDKGVKSAHSIASVLSEIYIHIRGIGGADDASNTPTHEELDVVYSQFPEVVDAHNKITALDNRIKLGVPTKITALYVLFARINKEMADRVMDMLYLVDPGPTSIDRISKILRDNYNNKQAEGFRSRIVAAGIIHAWNALVTGRNDAPNSVTKWTVGGYPKIIGISSMMVRDGIVDTDTIKTFPHIADMLAARDLTKKDMGDERRYNSIIASALRGPGKINISVTAGKLGVNSRKLNKMLNMLDDAGIIKVSGKGRDRIIDSNPEMAYRTGYITQVIEETEEAGTKA